MRSKRTHWLYAMLVAVLATLQPGHVAALFYCSSMNTLQAHCCCERQGPEVGCDSLDKAACCRAAQVASLSVNAAQGSSQADVPQAYVSVSRLPVSELYRRTGLRAKHRPLTVPRAIGPPILLRTQKRLL